MGKRWGYVRVSTLQQDMTGQRYEVLEYARQNGMHIDDFIEIEVSSRRDRRERRIDELVNRVETGDTVIVSESLPLREVDGRDYRSGARVCSKAGESCRD